MKRAVFCTLIVFAFVSCDSLSRLLGLPGPLIGTWEASTAESDPWFLTFYDLTFQEDYFDVDAEEWVHNSGTYGTSDDTLTLGYSDESDSTYKYSVDGSTLILTSTAGGSSSVTFAASDLPATF